MLEVGVAPDMGAVITLFLVSLLSLIGGVIFQKWPDKVQAATEAVDGYAWLVTPEVQRAMIVQSGVLLRVMSFAALLGAAWVLSQ